MNDVTPANSTDQYKFTGADVYCAVAKNNANVTCKIVMKIVWNQLKLKIFFITLVSLINKNRN